ILSILRKLTINQSVHFNLILIPNTDCYLVVIVKTYSFKIKKKITKYQLIKTKHKSMNF
ncbi:unnamed protein product, partial [Larinioides sclopetarius]